MSGEIRFDGAPEAMADLRRWADQVAPAVAKAAEPFARHVADTAAGKIPVVTGRLAGSVVALVDDAGVGVTEGDGVPYAGWIEFGGARGRPYIAEGRYLYPTAEQAQDEYERIAAAAAEESAGRFAWSTPTA